MEVTRLWGRKNLKIRRTTKFMSACTTTVHKMEIKERGGNFFSKAVCWLKDRLFLALAPFMPGNTDEENRKQQGLDEFTSDLYTALGSLGKSAPLNHHLIQKAETVRNRHGAMRSGVACDILRELATLAKEQNRGDEIPTYAQNAFSSP